MSPLLAVAIVLLVLVVGLTLVQRRSQAQSPSPRRNPMPPSPPPAPEEPEFATSAPTISSGIRSDPVMGAISFYHGTWTTEADVNFHGSLILVEIDGSPDGPTHDDHEIVKAALATSDLDARGRALVVAELERRGEDVNGLIPSSLSVGPDEDGVLHGVLWYDAPKFLGEIGVKSADHWQTLTLVVDI